MKAPFFAVLFYSLLAAGCAVTKTPTAVNVLQPTALEPIGRYAMQDGQLQMISSGMHFGFLFEGTSCTLRVASPDQHNYLQYELDGVYQKRVRVEKGDGGIIEIKAPEEGKHTVCMFPKALCHSSGCKALRTKTIIAMSTLPGSIPSGRLSEDRSQGAARMEPTGGDVYKGFD